MTYLHLLFHTGTILFLSLLLSFLLTLGRHPWARKSFLCFCTFTLFFTSPLITLYERFQWQKWIPLQNKNLAQAVIILGGGTVSYSEETGAHLYHRQVGRLLEGLKLFQLKQIPFLIISGGDPVPPPPHWSGETLSSLKLLEQFHLQLNPVQRILMENESLNTHDEALILQKLLKQYGIKKSYLVTSLSHMQRSLGVFRQQGIEVVPYPVLTRQNDSLSWGIELLTVWDEWIHEWVGSVYYRWQHYL